VTDPPGSLRAVFDPNVLVSAAISRRGTPRDLLNRWERGEFELIFSAEVLFELQEVLVRPKFRRYLTEAEAIGHVLRIHDGATEISEKLLRDIVRGVTGDPDDDYLVGVAFHGRADVIVSGDRHLLDLGTIRDGVGNVLARVLTPREFMEELDRAV
jgi:putative PIN family toxin of toxin-antitoxin system